MLSLMWSEHCAYKHSRKLLRRLPTEGPHVLMGPGENAGAVDVGGGQAVAFKVESHNHPSAVEPFQGAATGVGGILRDVFAIGARPIAVLDSLRFGEAERSERSRYLLDRAVAGIGHYGNSIGVPTVGGEIYFEDSYEQNCLVNAMCLGLAPRERLIRAAAAGAGNVVVLLGALTGRDGIGGASVLASAELGEGDEAKRPSVQIGDPFSEKKLLECCLELLDRGLLTSLQDLGAAGLTSAVSEMASKGEVGIDIDLCRMPLREPDMEPFEIMVSESQERMLCVVAPERVGRGARASASAGRCWRRRSAAVTDGDRLRVLSAGERSPTCRWRSWSTTARCTTSSPSLRPSRCTRRPAPSLSGAEPADELLLALLRSANMASRRPVFEQYDPVVQSRTVRRPDEADAAVLALAIDGRPTPRDRGVDRRQRPARRLRSRRGAAEAVLRVRRQPGLRGRRAARPDQLPELRQPREAPRRLAAGRARRGPGRGLRGARRPGRRRQRVALQRGADRSDLSDAGRSAWSGACPTRPRAGRLGVRARGRRDRRGRAFAPVAGRLRARQASRRRSPARCRRSTSGRRRGRTSASATWCAPARCPAPTTSPKGGSRSHWPSARSLGARRDEVTLRRRDRAVRRGSGRLRGLRTAPRRSMG